LYRNHTWKMRRADHLKLTAARSKAHSGVYPQRRVDPGLQAGSLLIIQDLFSRSTSKEAKIPSSYANLTPFNAHSPVVLSN
jgi:hypothetical protein